MVGAYVDSPLLRFHSITVRVVGGGRKGSSNWQRLLEEQAHIYFVPTCAILITSVGEEM